ncbi:peptidase M23-like protein [Fluviicoccus keumensis]|uniref:Peptidase M23-like protein n=1 Tax=Fluviicoccus keumensis TaxID=1435465 RepID=A0A4Q7YFK0_9GAMM|nr:M23 family metallopeptidase [Fluviicoccus keumensis]RZU35383.1 peptidase M23-like protein [Fluviicoccus keumensis]
MKFPSWRRYAIKPLTLRLTPAALGTFATVLAFLSLAGGAIGYAVGAHHTTTAAKPVIPAVAVAPAVARDQQIQVMNQRIAELQARMMRLDALGQHLAESANLKSGEFNFDPKGPSGGPLVQDLSVMGSHPDIRDRLQVLSSEIERRENQLQALDSVLAGKRLQDNRQYLGNLPVRQGTVTSTFGYRTDPFTGHAAFHPGMDFSGPEGTDIYAVAPGVVVYAGERTGYGNVVEIDHGNGYVTRYAHARSLLARVGDRVAKDQLIALMGNTGRSTGTHLHYEVLQNNRQIDPATFVHLALRK